MHLTAPSYSAPPVVVIDRNRWSPSVGTGGRHRRNTLPLLSIRWPPSIKIHRNYTVEKAALPHQLRQGQDQAKRAESCFKNSNQFQKCFTMTILITINISGPIWADQR